MLLVFSGAPTVAYATGGSLKPTHAVTMHAILVLPMLAWLLSFADWTERRRVRVVLLGAAGYLALAAVVAVENTAGVRPSETPLPIVAVSATGTIALIAAGVLALGGVARATTHGLEHD
jgi:hypothetical protein